MSVKVFSSYSCNLNSIWHVLWKCWYDTSETYKMNVSVVCRNVKCQLFILAAGLGLLSSSHQVRNVSSDRGDHPEQLPLMWQVDPNHATGSPHCRGQALEPVPSSCTRPLVENMVKHDSSDQISVDQRLLFAPLNSKMCIRCCNVGLMHCNLL